LREYGTTKETGWSGAFARRTVLLSKETPNTLSSWCYSVLPDKGRERWQ